jgi:hypothetical protein
MSTRRPARAAAFPIALPIALGIAVLAPIAGAQPAGELFPQPYRIVHQTLESELDGTVYVGEPVRDTYGGSWIVSERADGSRLVIDLARRELTEIRPTEGVYWTIGFDRYADLRARLARYQARPVAGGGGVAAATQDSLAAAALEVRERPATPAAAPAGRATALAAAAKASAQAADALPARLAAGSRKFEVKAKGAAADEPAAEVWVDGAVRWSPAAMAAIERFEREALGATESAAGASGRLVAAVRAAADGAVPVRSVVPVLGNGGRPIGLRENRVTALDALAVFPAELVRVPEGAQRLSHPLESLLVALEAEARNDAELAGQPRP